MADADFHHGLLGHPLRLRPHGAALQVPVTGHQDVRAARDGQLEQAAQWLRGPVPAK